MKVSCFNWTMRNTQINIKEKLISKYLEKENKAVKAKSPNINILLNRVKLNQKMEFRKKIFFSTIASSSLLLFGLIIFN